MQIAIKSPALPGPAATPSSCVERQRANFLAFLQTIENGIDVRVNYVEVIPGDPADLGNNLIEFNTNSFNYSGSNTSRFGNFLSNIQTTTGNNVNEYSDMDRLSEIFMIEVYLPFSPVLGFVNAVLPFNIVNGQIYDATII